jgi:hypothetical protein
MKKIFIPVLLLIVFSIFIMLLNAYLPHFIGALFFVGAALHLVLFLFLMKWIKQKFYVNTTGFKQLFFLGISIVILKVTLFAFVEYEYVTKINPPYFKKISKLVRPKEFQISYDQANKKTKLTSASSKETLNNSSPFFWVFQNSQASFIAGLLSTFLAAIIFRTRENKTI